jgi:hypothetical protein
VCATCFGRQDEDASKNYITELLKQLKNPAEATDNLNAPTH